MGVTIFKLFNKHYKVFRNHIIIFDFFGNALAELVLVNLHFFNLNLAYLNSLVLNNRSHDSVANSKVLFENILFPSAATYKKSFTFEGFQRWDILNHIQRRTFEVVRQ